MYVGPRRSLMNPQTLTHILQKEEIDVSNKIQAIGGFLVVKTF